MGTSVGALRVDLSANAAQFGRDLGAAREHLRRTGDSFAMVGGIAGATGERMSRGLKRGVNDFRELGAAAGLAGGEFAKIGGVVTELALGGFNPLTLAIVGVGFAIGKLNEASDETLKKKIPEAVKVTENAFAGVSEGIRALQGDLATLRSGHSSDIGDIEIRIARQRRINERQYAGHFRPTDDEVFLLSLLEEELHLRQKFNLERQQEKLLLDQVANAEDMIASTRASSRAKELEYIKSTHAADADFTRLRTEHEASYKTYAADVIKDLRVRVDVEKDINHILDERRAKIEHVAELERDAAGYNPGYAASLKSDTDRLRYRDFSSELADLRKEMALTDRVGVAMANRLTVGLSEDLGNAFAESVMNAKSFGDAMRDVSRAVVGDVMRMVAAQQMLSAIMAGISLAGSASARANTARNSGEFGAIDNFHPEKSLMASKSGVSVEIHNNNGSQVRAEHSTDPDGRKRLRVLIDDITAENILAGGRTSQAAAQAFGLSRQPRRRG